MSESSSPQSPQPWWDPSELPLGHSGSWRIGPFQLQAQHLPNEWLICYRHFDETVDDSLEITEPSEALLEAEDADLLRVVTEDPSNTIDLSPRLADRPIVARPETPFLIMSGAVITLYVSSPLWMDIQLGSPPRQVLEVATWPMSDTWFGPSTTRGELCYAIKTNARLNLENLPLLPNRAVTQLRIENRTSDNVWLERLTLPAPNLSLYVDDHQNFWSQSVVIRVVGGGGSAEVDLGKGPPPAAVGARIISEPRARAHRNIFLRARHALFI